MADQDGQDGKLDSWKQIAAHLKRGVTTVQRWEQEEGLPVYRLPHAKRGSVFAFRHELDAWQMARAHRAPAYREPDLETSGISLPRWLLAAFALCAIVLVAWGTAWTLSRPNPAATAGEPRIAPRPLANDEAMERTPSLSPDGEQVVYHWRRRDSSGLYIKPVGGGPARPLPIGDVPTEGFPAWSPKGDLIAFLSPESESTRAVYLVPPRGGTPRRLAPASGIGLCWAPDGESLGFIGKTATDDPHSVFAIALETGQRTRLTTPPRGSFGDTHCAFSPDGRELAVVRYPTISESDVVVMDVASEGTIVSRKLTDDFEGISGLAWAPDGRSIVFGSHSGLWMVDPSVERVQKPALVFGGAGQLGFPTFSRQSLARPARLAYESHIRDVNLWRWNADAGQATAIERLPGMSTQWETHPAFSADGRRVAFASNRTGSNEIWTADAGDAEPIQVTFHGGPMVISPQWSPDGRRLAYSSQVGGNRDVYVMDSEGGQSIRLTWEPTREENPSWSRDGRWVYFRSDRTGIGQMWKISADGGPALRVTDGEASEGFESPDGKSFYFVRSRDVPGVWSIPLKGGQEKLVLARALENYWGVSDRGIAFIVPRGRLSDDPPTLQFLDLGSHRISTLATLPTATNVIEGFAVSRDGRSAIWTQLDRSQQDLMVIDPWR